MNIPDNQVLDIECQVRGTIGAGGSNSLPTYNTFYYRRNTLVNPFSHANFAAALLAIIQAPLLAAMNNRWTWDSLKTRCLNDATDAGISTSIGIVGGVAGDGMTSINAAYLFLKTGFRGGSYRGALHLGPMSEADTTGAPVDLFNAAALVRLNAVGAALLTAVTDASPNTFRLEVVSRKGTKARVNPTIVIGNQVTTIAVNKRVGRLKHREVGSVY